MENFYNFYAKFPYESEICFVEIDSNPAKNTSRRNLCYVVYEDHLKKYNGMYETDDTINVINKNQIIKDNKNILKDLVRILRYVTYIKIIRDNKNPHIEGSIMPFYYGRKIKQMMDAQPNDAYNKSFILHIRNTQGYANYDRSYFTDKNYNIRNFNLSVDNVYRHKRINLGCVSRMHKLDKIGKIIKRKKLLNEN